MKGIAMNVTVLFPPAELQRDAWFNASQPKLVDAYQQGRYQTIGTVPVGTRAGFAAAEEVFDLTNHPGRDDDREAAGWVRRRSLSVGDIVEINGEAWFCASVGWLVLRDNRLVEPA
jgi:chitodextrinase